MDLDKIIATNFNWDKRNLILRELSKATCVKFAIFCAEQVIHFTDLESAKKAIDVAKLYLEGKASTEECYAAASAAYAAASAASAAHAYALAYSAANAAYAAAYATYADAAAVTAAVNAATNAITSVTNSASATAIHVNETKVAQMNYLRNLILDNLTEEQKENWLLIVSI